MSDISKTEGKYILYYYILLLIVAFVLIDPHRQIPELIRVGYLLLVLTPAIRNTIFFVGALITFFGISVFSFCPILPTTFSYYVVIVFGFALFRRRELGQSTVAYLPFLYFFLAAMLHLDMHKGLSVMFVGIILSRYIKSNSDLNYLYISFLLISIFTSAIYYAHMDYFLMSYGAFEEGLEWSGWVNPNEFGLLLGCGAILAIAYLTNQIRIERNSFMSIISVVTLLLTIPVLILNASRGAFLSFAIVALYFLLFSRTKLAYKFLLLLVVAGFVVWLYSQGTFDLLLARMGDDTFDSGGGRTTIWQSKLDAFLSNPSYGELLFGIGMKRCIFLVKTISTHNDIVTAFIAYGLIGLILYLIIMLYPLIKGYKNDKIFIIGITLYMLMEACVAEPLFRGHFVFTMFYFFILRYIDVSSKTRLHK